MSDNAALDERIELIRAARSASETGDREAFERAARETMHPDGTWEPLIGGVEGRSYTGPEGIVAFFDDFHGAFEVHYGDTEYRQVAEDVFLELTTMHMKGRRSEVAVDRELAVVWRFEGDRVRHARAYDSHARAVADAEALDA
jgi:hypothetical protein